MSRALWLRFLAASAFFALVISALDLLLVREVAGGPSDEVQRSIYLFVARLVEEQPYPQSVRRVESLRADSPAMPLRLWVVSASGQVLAASVAGDPPARLRSLQRPAQVHGVVSYGRYFSGAPAGAVVRLDAAAPTYLLIHNPGAPGRHTFRTLGLLFIATVAGAILLGLSLLLLYLRGRSAQARQVIAQIESGNLSARFAADRLDAIGRLMADFNRMADEIERLVTRLQATERTRRELLQELGHDLRTPLTSLRTAIDTLAAHGDAMPAAERAEFFGVVSGELAYFGKLIEDLFFIAEIDEPRYRKSAERVALAALLAAEVQAAQGKAAARGIRFALKQDVTALEQATVMGDAYLIARLFRNVFDNAVRFARSEVQVTIAMHPAGIDVTIDDDGLGMTPEAIAAFGQRRRRRVTGEDLRASLGLGSVIIRTIVTLHDGRLQVASRATDPAVAGTRLTITLPRAPRE